MLESWTTASILVDGISDTSKDMRTLSLNVLAATGFGRSFTFRSAGNEDSGSDTASSYRNALSTVLDNVILLMLIPRRYLALAFVPKSLRKIGEAANQFKVHMEKMVEAETTALENNKTGSDGLMTSFIEANRTHGAGTKNAKGLSVEEIFGNIFVINFAGHDTTANTLAFAAHLLAINPDVQDWVAEEVQTVIKEEDDDEWDYDRLYPQLIRCRAVLVS